MKKNNRGNTFLLVVVVLGVIFAVGVGVWWTIAQWKECKELGHSTFYCINHIA